MLPRCNGINAVGLTLAATFKIWRAALAVRQRLQFNARLHCAVAGLWRWPYGKLMVGERQIEHEQSA
jgi:hypothetical protein